MTIQSTSATGGYLLPAEEKNEFPNGISFEDFLQTVFVGVSGLQGSLVRPAWQTNPPPWPDIETTWMKIALSEDEADTNAYVGIQKNGSSKLMRMEELSVQCSFYGPKAYAAGKIVRDGFQIQQNLEALKRVDMNFVSTGRMVRAPDIINERWVDRWEMTVYLRREIVRCYPILTLLSGDGVVKINNQGAGVETIPVGISQQEGQ